MLNSSCPSRACDVRRMLSMNAMLCPHRALAQAVIVALQLGNEPALNSKGYDAAVKVFYTAAAKAVSGVLPSLPLVMSFIPPNDVAVPAFVKELGAQLGGDTPLLIDHHWYLNWASPEGVALDWSELHTRACHEAANSWSAYTSAEVRRRSPLEAGERIAPCYSSARS